MTIKQAINEAKAEFFQNNIEDSALKAKILMQFVLKKNSSYIIANGENELKFERYEEFKNYTKKIIKGIPLQYITNKQEFMKLKFYVDENVLIPQPDTEILVEQIINDYKNSNVRILDLCTGSGAIGISLAKYIEHCKIICSDISNKAIQIAKLNAEQNFVHRKMDFILSDMFQNLKNIKVDVIASNPPYIKTNEIKSLDKEVQNEPVLALDGGQDGLKFYKIIAENAYKFLSENGKLYLEIGYDQKEDLINLLRNTNRYEDINCKKDLSGNNRVIIAKKR